MGDLISTVVGGGGSQTEQRNVDPTTQALNRLRLQQSGALLNYGGGPADFMQPYPGAYQAAPGVQQLYDTAMGSYGANQAYNIGNYSDLGLGSLLNNTTNAGLLQGDLYNQGLGLSNQNMQNQLAGLYGTLGQQNAANERMLGQGQAMLGGQYDRNIANAQGTYGTQMGNAGDVLSRQLGLGRDVLGQQVAYGQNALNQQLGLGEAGFNTQRQLAGDVLGGQNLSAQQSLDQQIAMANAVLGGQRTGAADALGVQRQLNAGAVAGGRENNAANYNQLYDQIKTLGLDQTSNYINQIARPQINQQMALQGLEGGGAVDAAIARATAEYGMPVVQSLAGLAGQYQGLQGGLNQQYVGGEQQAGGQYAQNLMNALAQHAAGVQGYEQQFGGARQAAQQQYGSTLAGAGSQYTSGLQQAGGQYTQGLQNYLSQYGQGVQGAGQQYGSNVQNIGQQYGANVQQADQQQAALQAALYGQYGQGVQSLQQQYGGNVSNAYSQNTAAQAALQQQYANNLAQNSQQFNQNYNQFIQSIPGAQAGFQQAGAQAANALFPLADYSRSLQAQDLARRQSLFGTTLTGLPYTAGGSVTQDKSQPSIFSNITGIGSNTGFFGKGTGTF